MKLTISCKEASDFISRQEEKKLSPLQVLQLWLHLGVCSFCRLFKRQNKILTHATEQMQHYYDVSLSQFQKDSLIEALNNETTEQ